MLFILESALLGVGLAMDAFSVSVVHGLRHPDMKRMGKFRIAGTFGFFQFLMPVIGWILVHTVISVFQILERFIPYIALFLLAYIGGKMIYEGFHYRQEEEEHAELLIQGIATSIDALSVGLTISQYSLVQALAASLIIAIVTLVICLGGIEIGKKIGTRITGRANVAGGLILIGIGLEIFIKGVFGK